MTRKVDRLTTRPSHRRRCDRRHRQQRVVVPQNRAVRKRARRVRQAQRLQAHHQQRQQAGRVRLELVA